MSYVVAEPTTSVLDQEIAAPGTAMRPTGRGERISSIDVLRGFALLGILVLNIDAFGNTEGPHDIPIGTPINNFSGPHGHLNLILLLVKWTFFEAKMRGIFSMLFGAGVLLMTQRAERRGAGGEFADTYLRRNMWLVFFGFLHGVFIWFGDILFDYGLAALLFLYPFRRLKAKTLLLTGTVLSVVMATIGAALFTGSMQDVPLSYKAAAISQRAANHEPISAKDQATLMTWQARVDAQQITPEMIKGEMASAQAGYWQTVNDRLQLYIGPAFSQLHVDLAADNLSAMLIGMGLFKLGFFTAEMSYASYAWTVLIGFGISMPLYVFGILRSYADHFNFITMDKWVYGPYYLTREPGMLAIAAVIILLAKSGTFRTPQRLLAAVGRTALSNYLMTSLICQFIFVWGPWKLFGTLEYYQLMYVVFGVWAFNLMFSTLWLRYFEFGPFEWLWRSLTYWKAQPMRLRTPA
jgi:uncharacterized protein